MFKNLTKTFLLLLTTILAFFITFCNYLGTSSSINQFLNIYSSETIGDRGGSHLPELGFHITLQPWLVVLVCGICAVCIVLICVLVHIKHKNTKKVLQQMQENADKTKEENLENK